MGLHPRPVGTLAEAVNDSEPAVRLITTGPDEGAFLDALERVLTILEDEPAEAGS